MDTVTPPSDWRASQGLTLKAFAQQLGVRGRNPARTVQRWERGQRSVPAAIIAMVEQLSDGKVTAAAWAALKPINTLRSRKITLASTNAEAQI